MQPDFDSRAFRQVLGEFATGVTIVACQSDGEPAAMTANAFTSVSLDPALVLVSIANTARMLKKLTRKSAFSISILNGNQAELAKWYGGSKMPANPQHWQTAGGLPVIAGATVHLGCHVTTRHRHGDHHLIVAQVDWIANRKCQTALAFHQGSFAIL